MRAARPPVPDPRARSRRAGAVRPAVAATTEFGGTLATVQNLTPATELDRDRLVALVNEVYADYAVPLRVDAGTLAFMQEAFDIAPEASRVAWREGRPVGLAFLGIRGDHGWVGGMGVIPAERRKGVGERLMRELLEAARAAGVRELRLEVLEQNRPARTLYEKLGFRVVRRLEVWCWGGTPPPLKRVAQAGDPRAARRRITAARREPEPWQRADETLDRLDVSTPALRAVSTDEGDAIYRVTDGRASVLQLHASGEAAAGELLDTIRTRPGITQLRFLNVPASDPASAALRARGATCEVTQVEMSLALARG